MSFWKRYDWSKYDKKRLGKWGAGFMAILVALFGLEMAGVGNPEKGDTLTEFSVWLAYLSKPVAAGLLTFVTWFFVHFTRRLVPALFKGKDDAK